MKKVLALIIAAMMIVSMIPVMAITTSAADVEGDWTTYRTAAGYEEPEEDEEPSYTPAPGYEYTDEGFHMTSADYTGCTPFGTIQSKEKISIQDGVYMELRIDQYPYGGENGTADHWIAFSIWDSQKITPGNVTDYGQGWLDLTRTPGAGGAGSAQSFVCSSEGAGSFGHKGDVTITPELDENGKEIYTFEIAYDGTNYTVSICGVAVAGAADITAHLNNLDPNGEFYIGVSFHSGVAGAPIEATMLKFGTSKEDADTPVGSDSAKPEDNINVTAPIADSNSIEANQPCLLFDATGSSWSGKLTGSAMELTPQGDDSFKVEPSAAVGFHQWGIKKSLSYEAADFPVIGIFVHDPNELFMSGTLRYSAGLNMSADDVHIINYSIYDEGAKYWGDDEEYTFMVINLKELLSEEAFAEGWNGRINSLRFDYADLYLSGDAEEDYFFFHYAGIFRSVEEAYAYQDAYAIKIGLGEASTEAPTEEPTQAPETEEPTEAPTTEDATKAPEAGTTGEAKTEAATKAQEGGCASVIGSAAVLMAAAAAAVVLKKKD